LEKGTVELPITITSDLKVSLQCLNAVGEANKVLGMFGRQFHNLDKNVALKDLLHRIIRPMLFRPGHHT